MARALTAYLVRKDVPDREALQAALKEMGSKLTLDGDAYKGVDTQAYVACTLDGEDAGFNLKLRDPDGAPAEAAGKDVAAALTWGGDPREASAVYWVGAALAQRFGAVVAVDGKVLPADKLIAKAKAALEE